MKYFVHENREYFCFTFFFFSSRAYRRNTRRLFFIKKKTPASFDIVSPLLPLLFMFINLFRYLPSKKKKKKPKVINAKLNICS